MTNGSHLTSTRRRPLQVAFVFILAFALQGMTLALFHDSESPQAEAARSQSLSAAPDVITQTFVVVTTDDDGEGSLRWAINEANALPGSRIIFGFFEPEIISIPLRSQLPPITASVTIDGGRVITQTHSVTLDGSNVIGNMIIITKTHGVVVQGLRFTNVNDGAAIAAYGSSNVELAHNAFQDSRQGALFEFTTHISIPHNRFLNIDRDALALGDGSAFARLTDNAFVDVGRYGVALDGGPPPTHVMIRDNLFDRTLQPILLGPGANDDFPAPTLSLSRVMTNPFILEASSSADPSLFAYPLSFDLYRVRDGEYRFLDMSFEYSAEHYPQSMVITVPHGGLLRAGSSVLNTDHVALLATTANPMTSEFSEPVPLLLPRPVAIDIKPGSDPNCINLSSRGVVPVAVLGDAEFDVGDINQTTLELEGATVRMRGESGTIGSFEDVNDDGFMDLVVHFPTLELQLSQADESATLTGELHDGTFITGSDTICIVPPSQARHNVADDRGDEISWVFALDQNYPNPFNPATTIRFQVQESTSVVVRVYNLLGQEVRTLVNGHFEPGSHVVRWNATDNAGGFVPSGVYVYSIRAGDFTDSRRMLLLR